MIYNAATGVSRGAPIVRVGTKEQIRAALPGMAAEIARRIGLNKPEIPTAIDMPLKDLALLGRTCWTNSPTEEDRKALQEAGSQSALAAVCSLALSRGNRATDFNLGADRLLEHLAPPNALAWGSVGYMDAPTLLPHAARLDALRRAYPRNYALGYADVLRYRFTGNVRGEYTAAIDSVSAAAGNPDAWLTVGWSYSSLADKLRRGRIVAVIHKEELTFLEHVYPLWERAVIRAAEIDSQHEAAWERVAKAATFCGDIGTARDAYGKSERYNRDKASAYGWGLEMFQLKWGGDPQMLTTVAEHAEQTDFRDPVQAGRAAIYLRSAGQVEAANAIINRCLAKAEAAIATNTNDLGEHNSRAALLFLQGRVVDACQEYATVAQRRPSDPLAQYAYGFALLGTGALDKAIPILRRVLEIDPDHRRAPLYLARALQQQKQFAEAEKWARIAVQRIPNSPDAHYLLGEICQWGPVRRHAEAAAEFLRCADLTAERSPTLYAYLAFSLVDAGRPDDAVRWAEEGDYLFSPRLRGAQLILLWSAVAKAYVAEKRYKDAIAKGESALTLAPQDINIHEALGDAYNGVGRRADARKSWQLVVDRCSIEADPEGVGHAKEMLSKYPENGT